MKIYVATYDHEYGIDVRAFKNPQSAENWKNEIANEWWDHEFPDEEKPETDTGDEYFHLMCNRNGDAEFFSVNLCEVEE